MLRIPSTTIAGLLALGSAAACVNHLGASEHIVPLGSPEAWSAEPGWLGNPARGVSVRSGTDSLIFRVEDPGCGMKWQRRLKEPFPLAPYRHVTIRYRTTSAVPRADYLLAILVTPEGGPAEYRTPILPAEIRPDGRWHTASGSLGVATEGWRLDGFAVQVQAGGGPAEIEVAEIRCLSAAPLRSFDEELPRDDLNGDALSADDVLSVDVAALATTDASELPALLGFRDWFSENAVLACGVPFRLVERGQRSISTGLESTQASIRVPVSGRAPGIALLLVARFVGNEEPAVGSGELREIRDVDRVLFRAHYATGTPDEMLCLAEPAGFFGIAEGPQVAVLFSDPERDLESIELVERSRQVELHVLAATALKPGRSPFEKQRPQATPPRFRRLEPEKHQELSAETDEGRAILRGGALEVAVDLTGLVIERLRNGYRGADVTLGRSSRLLRIAREDGSQVRPESWAVREVLRESPTRLAFRVGLREADLDLELRGRLEIVRDELLWSCLIENHGAHVSLDVLSPELQHVEIGSPLSDVLFYPKRGVVLTAEPCAYARAGSGLFPVQFFDLSASEGGGLYVRTEDRAGLEKIYEASKGSEGARLSVRYLLRLDPGASGSIARTALGVHGGDWHAAFDAYREWLRGWHRPRLPLKPWFRETFNFRQRFLWFWDPLCDRETGRFRIDEALAEAQEAFGGIEYLHIMDWGSHPAHGRVYGRTGDYAPWDAWKGGAESFAAALRASTRAGVPTGLYVEGYLLEERGRLGQGPGKAWQILGPSGERRTWPGASEMFICPWVPAWRDVQVDTYRRLATMFPARGVYIDQLGFADWGKSCWSTEHGHPVPARPLLGERELTRAVSEALATMDPEIAVYTEETPCDLASGFQDGSFTYAMNDAQRTETEVPLNIARFAFPTFKTFEILVCDQPTGSWATGVLWTFFNGEGIWLEGPAKEWFAPQTLAAIRKTHAILREHRHAFATLEPEPLVPTLAEGIHANRFPGEEGTVYTLWNSLPITVRAPVLALPEGARNRTVRDLYNEVDVRTSTAPDGTPQIELELPPYGVGCILVPR